MTKITLTVTSCKRFLLLQKTLQSFFYCCQDKHMIQEILLIDDNSDSQDIIKIIDLLQSFNICYKIIFKSEFNKGHQESLNLLYDLVKTDYVLHLEDDWLFKKKDNFITKSLIIMSNYPEIKQVLLRINPDIMGINQKVITVNNDIDFIRYNFIGQHHRDRLDRPAWPGWNLNPAVWNFRDMRTLGKFNQIVKNFEFKFSRMFWKSGFKVGYFKENCCEHIGEGNSSYKLNGTDK